jgi:hypothetical protein
LADAAAEVADDAEDADVVVKVPFPAAVVDAAEPVAAEAELVTVDEQTTAVGRPETPCVSQNDTANAIVAACSAVVHMPATQQAMPEMKLLLAQMQAASSSEQPPMDVPVVNSVTHPSYDARKNHRQHRSFRRHGRQGYDLQHMKEVRWCRRRPPDQ